MPVGNLLISPIFYYAPSLHICKYLCRAAEIMRKFSVPKKRDHKNWCVYILQCRNSFLYTGITNNLEKRLREHEMGRGSKFVRAWRPFLLVKTIPCINEKEARALEYQIKRLKRSKKLLLLKPNGHLS
jgi:putative endonuclease